MDSQKLKELLSNKEVQDYSYLIIFLLVFSFFAFFVIRPVLSVGVSLQKEAEELKAINEIFDENIRSVIKIQTDLESIREDRYLIDSAMPSSPSTGSVIGEVESAAASAGVTIDELTINETTYKSEETAKKELKNLGINMTFTADYAQMTTFLRLIHSQRRLKTIDTIKIVNTEIEGVTRLEVTLKLAVYYI